MNSKSTKIRKRRYVTPYLITAGLLAPAAATGALAETESTEAADPGEATANVPPPTIDTNGDNTPDAWDRDGNSIADAWDVDGDMVPDLFDDDGDGAPDTRPPDTRPGAEVDRQAK
jgi:hypothetical protein